MDREDISGMSKEFDRVLGEVSAGAKPKSLKAWRRPVEAAEVDNVGEAVKPAVAVNAGEVVKPAEAVNVGEAVKPAEASEIEKAIKPEEEPPKRHRRGRSQRPGVTRGPRVRTGRSTPAFAGLHHPSDGLIAAFFIPIIIMIVIFAQRGIFPFGQDSFLRTDMYHQYAPFFSEFQNKLSGGGSLLYSWDIGMGVNFAALYAYYLASPLNWLLILCPKAFIIEFMTYSVVLKIGLSGLTFAYYLRKHNHTSDFGVAFFGIFYALSGYMAAYSWNIMWLDCILLFPLIMLGLEKLVKEKKGLLYCITLGVCILSNYYISIMICAFMVMYFVCLLIMEGRRSFKDFFISFLQFGIYSLIAGGLAAVVLLPEIYALQSTASGNVNFPKTFEMYFSIIDMLARHIGNVQVETGLDHWPNIFCGVAVYMFFLLYLFCKKIPAKEKTVTCGLLLMFFASFSVNVLNFVWHGFHYPNSLPARQSFIYIFLMLALCYRAYMYLEETPKKHIAVSFWASISFVLLAQKLVTDKAYHFSVFYAAIIFLAIYTGLIYFYKNPKRSKTVAALLTLSVVAVEAAVNTTVTSVSTTSRSAYVEDNENVSHLTQDLTSDNGFYRVEKIERRTKNDGAWMNFPSVSIFSSLAHADLTSFFKKIGCEGSTNAYSITGGTPVVDSLFSVKYALYDMPQDNPRLIFNATEGNTYLYENPSTLPLGFIMPPDMEEWQMDIPNPIEVQNALSDVLDVPAVFTEVEGESVEGSFTFVPERDGEYYVYIGNKSVKSVKVSKSEETMSFDNVNRGYLLELGYCIAGETINISSKEEAEGLSAMAYVFEEEGFKAMYDKLNVSPFLLTKWEDDNLAGVVETEEEGTLFLSIPYDKGWEIMVDNKPVTARKVFDAFMGIDVTQGRHTITLKYTPQGLKTGVVISASALAALLLITLAGYFLKKRQEKERDTSYDKLDEEWHGMMKKEEDE